MSNRYIWTKSSTSLQLVFLNSHRKYTLTASAEPTYAYSFDKYSIQGETVVPVNPKRTGPLASKGTTIPGKYVFFGKSGKNSAYYRDVYQFLGAEGEDVSYYLDDFSGGYVIYMNCYSRRPEGIEAVKDSHLGYVSGPSNTPYPVGSCSPLLSAGKSINRRYAA